MIKDGLIIEQRNRLRVMTLNRPEALNALNYEMVLGLHDVLDECHGDDDVSGLVLQGTGGRAFCAGGDVKAAREAAIHMRAGKDDSRAVDFFVAEYGLNKKLFHYPKPIVAVMDGITMGGGVGVAGPCKYRIATPKTVWAMPEVSIGFFPDVGAMYYLSHAPQGVGAYLAMTGASVKNAGDLLYCGLAMHYSEREDIIDRLAESNDEHDLVTQLAEISATPPEKELPYDRIKTAFAGASVEEILAKLDPETEQLIRSKSPTGVHVALKHLQMAVGQSFDDIIARDLHLAKKFLIRGDMVEGIRAVLVDKDRNPQWRQNITYQEIDWYFN